MTDEPVFRVRVDASTLDDLRAFADQVEPDLGCRPVARRTAAGYTIDVYLPESKVDDARARSTQVTMTVQEDAVETGRARQAEVGQGNRYAARGEVPRGLGRKE